ncbi:hypothetical protein Q8F55_002176 [Vanrija albida]|uniref:Nickel/cobalt efflux system n=1 Tax=Vanrija albida TaxID=181172 RepID=A0ABR3Q924_9TREE
MTLRTLAARVPHLTLLGRAVALIAGELLFNAACWVAAGICFGQRDGLIGIALLAWTLGLRHGLDADHISAIDNATRQMVSMGQLPITCGLFFSLGHSTIVIAVNVAIAVSVDIYDKLDRVGSVGGIVGTSVSASFLFLVACINTFFLVGAVRYRKRQKARAAAGLPPEQVDPTAIQGGGCLVRIIAPVMRAVDKPWKLYPVGVLFGFGFDTASSIALLAISAIATRGPNGEAIAHGRVVILPFLFTAGMSLVDSLDSVLMLYAYAQPALKGPDRKVRLFYRPLKLQEDVEAVAPLNSADAEGSPSAERPPLPRDDSKDSKLGDETLVEAQTVERESRILAAKASTISSLSISLTLLSILVALSISLIEIMGLIGENCTQCREAAEAEDGGGLAGSWWRAWARANDASGYVGAAIVGCFVAILIAYHVSRWLWKRRAAKRRAAHEAQAQHPDEEHVTTPQAGPTTPPLV